MALKPWEQAQQDQAPAKPVAKKPWQMTEQELAVAAGYSEPDYDEMPAGEVAMRAVGNFPSSLAGVASDIYEAVTSPIDTAHNLVKIGAGALQAALPENFVQAIGEDAESRDMWEAVANFYADRYGSFEGFKKAVAEDPASVMADAATVLSAGAGVVSKAGLPAKVTSRIQTAARIIDPVTGTMKAAQLAGKMSGKGVETILGITTGAGTKPIQEAYKAGKAGGKAAEQFVTQMRGQADPTDMLNAAKANLSQLKMKRSQEYKAKLAELGQSDAVLSFDPIYKAAQKTLDDFTFEGVWKTKENQAAFNTAMKEINDWNRRDPKFHTAEGFDALKQRIYDIAASDKKGLNPAVGSLYQSNKQTIADQAPIYDDMMSQYTKASEEIAEIQRSLSVDGRANADTAMRKLQSLMRDNVQTNYGQRVKLGEQLEAGGTETFMPGLAGQTMADLAPRGLAKLPAVGVGASAALTDPVSVAAAVPYLAASSPRLVGEAAHAAGQLSRGTQGLLGMLPQADYGTIANLLYQSQQPKED